MTGTLIAIGAGPKTVAVAAKAAAAARLGRPVPRIVAVERRVVGGNWLAGGGWTDGRQRLGTSPDKDVGFPYRSGRELDRLMAGYSWTAHLIDLGTFSGWVDRGRPSPRHAEWARYLQWVADRSSLEVVTGRADALAAGTDGWQVTVTAPDGSVDKLDGDALMVTGPGPAHSELLPGHAAVLDLARFWARADRRDLPPVARAAVIGGGESAASVLHELTRHDVLSISVVSPGPTLFTRGESYFENALYSDPTTWRSLGERERREVIDRTDRGVFSVRVQDELMADDRIQHVRGRVTGAHRDGRSVVLTTTDRTVTADLVVDATGGRPLWFIDLFDPSAADLIELAVGFPVTQRRIENAIGTDLAVTGMRPRLFLPTLAGPSCGPGFPNLSCLGTVADRVLGALTPR